MAYKVSITSLTFLEIDEAIFWYEKQLLHLGKQFLVALNKSIDKIRQKPENYLLIYPPVRRTLLKNFLASFIISSKAIAKLLQSLCCTQNEATVT